MLEIMAIYGWDFYQYWEQPDYILELAKKKLEIEGKLAQQARDGAKQPHGLPNPQHHS